MVALDDLRLTSVDLGFWCIEVRFASASVSNEAKFDIIRVRFVDTTTDSEVVSPVESLSSSASVISDRYVGDSERRSRDEDVTDVTIDEEFVEEVFVESTLSCR